MITDVLEADLDGNLPTTMQPKVSNRDLESVDGVQESEDLQKTSLLLYLSDRPKLVSFTLKTVTRILRPGTENPKLEPQLLRKVRGVIQVHVSFWTAATLQYLSTIKE